MVHIKRIDETKNNWWMDMVAAPDGIKVSKDTIELFKKIKGIIDDVIRKRGLQGKLYTEYKPNEIETEQCVDIYYKKSGIMFGHIQNSWRGEHNDYWDKNKHFALYSPKRERQLLDIDEIADSFNDAIETVRWWSTCLD